jgi:hypothetical protein
MSNCDEFIYYDDLVAAGMPPRGRRRGRSRAAAAPAAHVPDRKPEKPAAHGDPMQTAIDLVLETAEALYAERGDRAKIWGSMVKQTLQRRRPGFNESAYGFGSFNDLLEEAKARGQLELEMDERSGGYVIRRVVRE